MGSTRSDDLAPITLTIVYAVYAVGVVASLVLAGHVSDSYGRRTVLIPGLLVAGAASVVFLAWTSLAGLLVARLLTGVALIASVATATASARRRCPWSKCWSGAPGPP